jgi:hypothetical protein
VPEVQEQLKACIEDHKKIRSFYENCICLPLVRSDSFTVFQYSDEDEKTVILQLFEEKSYQKELVVYPKLSNSKRYKAGSDIYTTEQLTKDGIRMTFNESVRVSIIVLKACE